MRPDDEGLDRTLRTLSPQVPPDLRRRCLEPDAGAAGTNHELYREVIAMRRRRTIGRGAGLAVAAALVMAVALGVPGGGTTAAEALGAALAALDGIGAARVVTTTDDGPGTPVTSTTELLLVRDVGSRFEHEAFVEVHNAVEGRRSLLDRVAGTVEVTAVQDPLILKALLERADAGRNVSALHALALRDEGAVTDEIVRRGGRRVLRLEGLDQRGREIVVELDPVTRRMLRAESWTHATDEAPAVRVVSTFSYPDPASIDASEFAVVPEEAVRVVEPSALVQARTQCMVTLRDLAAMAVVYADAHDGTLPRAVEDLAPYADRPIADCLQCAVPGRDEPALIESRLAELAGDAAAAFDSRTVLFECRFGDVVLRAFGDGHVEAHEDGS